MKKNNLVSIIIPCYNQAQYLEEAVQSAIDQIYPNIEIIIVNDGSSDNTQEIAKQIHKKYPEKIQIITQKNMGLYAARNNGIAKASGIFIVPLDADDKLNNEMISKCMKTIEKYDSDIVYVGYQRFGLIETSNLLKPFSDSNPLYVTPCSATAFFKKEIWKNIGGYKKNMSDGYEDWEFWINAYKHGYKFQQYPEILFYYRVKEESMFTNAYKKEDYLKSKIVMNHPELYTRYRYETSIEKIKEVENFADFYFYAQTIPDYKEDLMILINNYLAVNTLKNKQTLHMVHQNIKVKLYSLDILKNLKHLKQLLKKENTDFILFFSSIRYQIPSLKNCDMAWKLGRGMVTAEGTIFPYVFKDKKEDISSQFIAYQRLERYNEREKTILNGLIGRQKRTIQEHEKTFKEQEKTFKEQLNTVNQKHKEQLNITNKKYLHISQEYTEINSKNASLKNELAQAHRHVHLVRASASYRLGRTLLHEKKTLVNPQALLGKIKIAMKLGDNTAKQNKENHQIEKPKATSESTSNFETDTAILTQALDPKSGGAEMILSKKRIIPSNLSSLSVKISKSANTTSEFDYLLEYAAELRKMEMSETYAKLIKYLLVQFNRLSEEGKNNLKPHLANVIKLSNDEDLIKLLLSKHVGLFKKLDLSPKVIDSILGIKNEKLVKYNINNHVFFDLHTEPNKAISYIESVTEENLKNTKFEHNLIYCNLYSKKNTLNEKKYLKFFNKYLDHVKLPNVEHINLENKNILSSIVFKKIKTKPQNDLISVVMSAFEAEETIEYAIKSLLLQTHRNIEILVCDDGSTDNTLDKILLLSKSDKRIRVFKSNSNQGTYNIRNDMIERANGKYITFQDSDDYALPNRLELQLKGLTETGKTMCCSQWMRIKPSGSFVFFHDNRVNRFCVVSSMLKKEVFKSIPKFRQSLVAADTEFYQSILTHYGKEQIHFLSIPLILGLADSTSLTNKENLSADNSGFVAQRRRLYSDIAARQRLLGNKIISNNDIDEVLKNNKIYMEHSSVKEFIKGEWQ